MTAKFSRAQTRRDFLKKSGTLAALGIATSLTPDLLFAAPKSDLKGVTIDYWNMIGVQNKMVRRLSTDIIKAFEQRTGATVNVSWNSYGDIVGPKYRTNLIGGIKPTVFDACARWTGQLRSFLRPLNDFIENKLDEQTRTAIEWTFPIIKQQNSGFDDADDIMDLPFGLIAQAPAVVRRDHFERAGIDFEKNFPIRDTDHYIQLCKELQGAGIKYPTEVYGKIWDFADTQLNGWIRSVDAANDDFIDATWSHSTATSEAWIKGVQFYVDVFRKHKLSSPQTVQSSDEASLEELIKGRKSIVHADLLNRGTLLNRLPDEMADGTIQWSPHFPLSGGTSGSHACLAWFPMCIVKQEGPDAALKEEAAFEFIKEWLLPENQIAYAQVSGFGARRDTWDASMGAPDGYGEAMIAMLETPTPPRAWSNHPKSVDFQYNLLAPHGQKMLQGAPVETELKAYAAKVDEALQV